MLPLPSWVRTRAAMIVVTFESRMAEKARENPWLTTAWVVFPSRDSSFILSNISTFASTAIPMVRTRPAMAERVRVNPNTERIATLM